MSMAEEQQRIDNLQPRKYRKKPIIIDAVQLKRAFDSIQIAFNFVYPDSERPMMELYHLAMGDDGILIKTLEGTMKASFDDYIIKGVKGEFYPCKADIFEKSYEEVG